MSAEAFNQQTSRFLAWFSAQPGTTFHKDIEIQDLRSRRAGRGIVATADIPADTVLFTIPRQSIICAKTSSLVTRIPDVFDSSTDQEDEQDCDHLEKSHDSWTSLILILIYEHLQGDRSPWKPYLDILPREDGFNTPMFWTGEELAELQASPVADQVGKEDAEHMIMTRVLGVIKAHEEVFFPEGSLKPSHDELSRFAFRMGSVIMAYAFDLEKDEDEDDDDDEDEDEWVEDREGKTMLGMVPMADILNADATFNAHIEHGEHALVATSLRPIAKGEEILNYYGPLSNGELLRRYGYVTLAHRRWNLVDLTWESVLLALKGEVGLSEEEYRKVVETLDQDEMDDAIVIDRRPDDPDSEGRVSGVEKKAQLPEELLEQLKTIMKVVKKVKQEAVPSKTARDRLIYTVIAKALDERTKQYSTTLEQDMELYGKFTGGSELIVDRRTMALDVRIGEKVLLREASEAAKAKLAELAEAQRGGDEPNAKRRKI